MPKNFPVQYLNFLQPSLPHTGSRPPAKEGERQDTLTPWPYSEFMQPLGESGEMLIPLSQSHIPYRNLNTGWFYSLRKVWRVESGYNKGF